MGLFSIRKLKSSWPNANRFGLYSQILNLGNRIEGGKLFAKMCHKITKDFRSGDKN